MDTRIDCALLFSMLKKTDVTGAFAKLFSPQSAVGEGHVST